MSKQNEPDLKAIGQRLLDIRKKLKMKQTCMAKELDVSAGSLSEMEKGKNRPAFPVLFYLPEKFNVNLRYLLYGEQPVFNRSTQTQLEHGENDSRQHDLLEQFARYFNKSELVRLTMLAYFKQFWLRNKKVIQMDVNEKNQTETNEQRDSDEIGGEHGDI